MNKSESNACSTATVGRRRPSWLLSRKNENRSPPNKYTPHAGSFATASCLLCKRHFPGSSIEPDVYASRVPLCPYCTPELERLARERERERELERERGRKRRKVKEGEWDEYAEEEEESAEEEEQGGGGLGGEGRSEWSGKAVIKPDIVFFG